MDSTFKKQLEEAINGNLPVGFEELCDRAKLMGERICVPFTVANAITLLCAVQSTMALPVSHQPAVPCPAAELPPPAPAAPLIYSSVNVGDRVCVPLWRRQRTGVVTRILGGGKKVRVKVDEDSENYRDFDAEKVIAHG